MEREAWVVTDCGSTTSKSIVFSNDNGNWRMIDWAVSPTTVEAPTADVTYGVKNSFQSLNEREGTKLLYNESGFPKNFLATSSAGGGLRVAVVALTKEITGEYLIEAALHAGAIISAVISLDDNDSMDVRIEKLRDAMPDILIVAAGFKNSVPAGVIELVALIKDAALVSRLDALIKIPLIFAGSKYVTQQLDILKESYELFSVETIAVSAREKSLLPTEEKIHTLFLESVMEHAPGYKKLLSHVSIPILPTPVAVSKILEAYSIHKSEKLLCIDMGGATTDIFSTGLTGIDRTVSSNVGMSYSSYYVFEKVGIAGFRKYLPLHISDEQIEASIFNKMLRPTTIPSDANEQEIEYALCRLGLEISYTSHVKIISRARQQKNKLSIENIFSQNNQVESASYDRIIASGGVFSHCPNPDLIPWILADGLSLSGISEIVVDKVFMLPHLGMLYQIRPDASMHILEQDCLGAIGIFISIKKNDEIIVNSEKLIFNNNHRRQILEFKDGISVIKYKQKEKYFSLKFNKIYLEIVDS
jgi:uncharacterized protein (TIGR01319 family)